MPQIKPQEVLDFWFKDNADKHWTKSDAFDKEIRDRFLELHGQITAGETWSWRDTPEGRLAEIVVLDQFSRNMFRDTPAAFASDPLALALAQEAVRSGDDQKLPENLRSVLYMPYMHSESRAVHVEALRLFQSIDPEAKWEVKHKDIIDRFGRYPHRNPILGRKSTPEEETFFKEHGGF